MSKSSAVRKSSMTYTKVRTAPFSWQLSSWRTCVSGILLMLLACTTTLTHAAQYDDAPDIANNDLTSPAKPADMVGANSTHPASQVYYEESTGSSVKCQEGLVIPLWTPLDNLSVGDRVARGFVYFLLMAYLFVGVSIVSDRFMASIEVITSKEKEVTIKKKNGEKQIVVVRVWNETVANLTLMALGSSAPEILLSVIEMFAKNFEAGDLGPGTIVGSAAYNLFVIIAVCVVVVPNGQVRKIKHLRVFFVTATWSVFAYIWLYLILAVITPGSVEIWEGLLTFMFFPTTVLTAYIADRRLLIYKYLDKNYRMNKRGVIVSAERETALEMDGKETEVRTMGDDVEETNFEEARRDYISLLKELRKKYPQSDLEQLEMMAQEQLINRGPKSRAFYRIQATRKMVGSGNIMRKVAERAQNDMSEVKAQLTRVSVDVEEEEASVRIMFEPGHYTVMESCGEFEVRVVRRGDLSLYTTVDYQTEDGSAEAGSDYIGKKGTLTFPPGVDEQRFKIEVIDDDVFEQDEHFYIRLSNPSEPAVLSVPKVATVMILDDDHAGIFAFSQKDHELVESVGSYALKVQRYSGARGKVIIPYWTEDGTAKGGKDFEPQQGELVFENNETEKFIELGIIEEGSYEKDVLFYVNMGEPIIAADDELAGLIQQAEAKRPEELTEEDKMALLGRPKNGEITRVQLRIKESMEFKNTVDKLVQRANASLVIGTSSWKEQFTDALTVTGGDDDDEEGEQTPSCCAYIMHFLTLFWKIIFAFIPPTDMMGGYLCFVVSIALIGVLTAVIGDVASYFGCTLGILDQVTAICFVALGTSIPDTFASMISAKQDKYADASVGNVTGSNAVNVFLGIGVAWTMAAIYHGAKGNSFIVNPGSLAFTVTLFCTEAAVAIIILLLRRSKKVGGELGGPKVIKYFSGAALLTLWMFYIILSSLEAYHIIGF